MSHLVAISIPPRLAVRPRWRDLPIPFIAVIKPDGEPDFRATDEQKRLYVIANRTCQLCGQGLGRFIFFVGGPASAEHLAYFEPPCHLDCLIYAMQVCPFIAGQLKHAEIADVQKDNPSIQIRADSSYTTVKSEWWIIVKATAFKTFFSGDRTILLRPDPVIFKTDRLHAATMKPAEWSKVEHTLLSA